MAPMAAAVAATKNNKQKIRRHLDAVNVGVGFEFLIIEVAGAFGLFDWFVERKPNAAYRTNRRRVSNLFWKILHFEARTGRLLDQKEEVSAIDFALPARRVREVRPRESFRSWECDASSHRFRPDWCRRPINMRGAPLPTLISSVKRQAYTECGVAGRLACPERTRPCYPDVCAEREHGQAFSRVVRGY